MATGIVSTTTGPLYTTNPVNPYPISTAPWQEQVNPSVAVAADPDLVIDQYATDDIDIMADLILQDIGGVELSKILRYDSLDGINQIYSPMAATSRVRPYHSNNLMGQEFSRLVADGSNPLNVSRYIEGETSRGIALENEPTEYDVEIQVALAADWVPFSASIETVEVT
jgi:hypothetical protein